MLRGGRQTEREKVLNMLSESSDIVFVNLFLVVSIFILSSLGQSFGQQHTERDEEMGLDFVKLINLLAFEKSVNTKVNGEVDVPKCPCEDSSTLREIIQKYDIATGPKYNCHMLGDDYKYLLTRRKLVKPKIMYLLGEEDE